MTPAMDRRSAARILDLAEPRGSRRLAVAAFAGLLAIAAHVAAGEGFPFVAPTAGSSPARAEHLVAEHAHMKRLMAVGAVAAMASSGAWAQDAVQWRVEDGGNGHWYGVLAEAVVWPVAKQQCEVRGGHLATLTSEPENIFAASLVGLQMGWIGAFQPPDTCEPGCGWSWVTGEPWVYSSWATPAPNENGPEDFAETYSSGGWNDMPGAGWMRRALIEWSADCNSDGIVDFGQIRAGELDDANGNNIPDCCENGLSCDGDVTAALVAHYPFDGDCLDASGSNRHGAPTAISFDSDLAGRPMRAAVFDGISSHVLVDGIPIPTNNAFTWALWIRCDSIGNPGSGTPILERIEAIGSNLLTPSLFVRPNGSIGFGSYSSSAGGSSVETAASSIPTGAWTHVACTSRTDGLRRVYVNGILIGQGVSPEYGQPLPRLLVGRDRVDCCGFFRGAIDDLRIYSRPLTLREVQTLVELGQKPACPGDIDENRGVDGVDLAIILTRWGQTPKDYPRADANGDGTVNGSDLTIVLNAWGACP